VNGIPLALALDTGAMRSMVRSDALPESQFRSFAPGVDASGAVLNIIRRVQNVRLGQLEIPTADVVVGPAGGWGGNDPRVGGLLGASFLSRFEVEIDLAAGKIRFYSQSHCPGRVVTWQHSDSAKIPVTVTEEGTLILPVTLDGKQMNALLDTGAVVTTLQMDTAEDLFGLKAGAPDVTPDGTSKSASGQAVPTYRHPFHSLGFEGIHITNPRILLSSVARNAGATSRIWGPHGRPFDLVLGMHELRNLHLLIAYGEKAVYATSVAGDERARAGAGDKSPPVRKWWPDPIDRAEARGDPNITPPPQATPEPAGPSNVETQD
jgi:hypothetical protein